MEYQRNLVLIIIITELLVINTVLSARMSSPAKPEVDAEKAMEREAFASIADELALANIERAKGEENKDIGEQALSLSKQDVANGNIDLAHSEIAKTKTMHTALKPSLGSVEDLAKKDKKLGRENYESAQEMHDTAKEDKDVTGKEDLERGKEDKENAERAKQQWDKQRMEGDKIRTEADKLRMKYDIN